MNGASSRTVEEVLKSAWGGQGRLSGLLCLLGRHVCLSMSKSLGERPDFAERSSHTKGRCEDSRRNMIF